MVGFLVFTHHDTLAINHAVPDKNPVIAGKEVYRGKPQGKSLGLYFAP